jgi:hypothetical protein
VNYFAIAVLAKDIFISARTWAPRAYSHLIVLPSAQLSDPYVLLGRANSTDEKFLQSFGSKTRLK